MQLYFIPGLGLDHRIFRKLQLEGFNVHYLNWIEPIPKETIQSYAKRMASPIPGHREDVVLIGHSLGGIMCQEIAAVKKVKKIILLGSIKSRDELPFRFKAMKPLRAETFFFKEIALTTLPLWGKRHEYETPEEQALFRSMVGQQTNTYLKWALRALYEWKAPELPDHMQIFQVHGRRDRTFPLQKIDQPDIILEDAGHFMVYKKPEVISGILSGELNTD